MTSRRKPLGVSSAISNSGLRTGVAGAIFAAVVGLYSQLGDLKAEVAALQVQVAQLVKLSEPTHQMAER